MPRGPNMEKVFTTDLTKVRRAATGQLAASSFNVDLCENCISAHFDGLDDEGRVFASALIPPQAFRDLAAWFCEAAEALEKEGLLKRGMQG